MGTANGRSGAEEARLPVFDELRKDTAGARYSRRQHFCQGTSTLLERNERGRAD